MAMKRNHRIAHATGWLFTVCCVLFSRCSYCQETGKKAPPEVPTTRQSKVSKDNVTLTVRTPKQMPAGEPYVLDISLVNNSKHDVRYGTSTKYSEWMVSLVTRNNKPVPFTAFGNFHYGGELGAKFMYRIQRLKLGESCGVKVNLPRFFDLSTAGTYTVKVVRLLNEFHGTKMTLESEPITIQVTDPDAPVTTP